jgi:hypothetical protein
MRKETGRLRRDANRALETLTGELGVDDADLWDAWWKLKGATLDIGPRPTPDRHGRVRRARRSPGAGRWSHSPGDPTETVASFFRLPIASTRLAFLFDLSGSMRDPADDGKPGTKVERARAEFSKAVDALPKETVFDLFVYRFPSAFPPAPRMTRAFGALTPAGAPMVAKRASEWLAKEQPRGWGAFYDGLVLATADEVDTIVLLSDGVPSMGTYDRGFRLVDEFVRANRFRRVAVDTVLVGKKGADRDFMQDLADGTGGAFQEGLR